METTIEPEAVVLIGRWVRARSQFEATMKARREQTPQPRTYLWESAAVDNLNVAEDAMRRFWSKNGA